MFTMADLYQKAGLLGARLETRYIHEYLGWVEKNPATVAKWFQNGALRRILAGMKTKVAQTALEILQSDQL
jgi:hypothetical protein